MRVHGSNQGTHEVQDHRQEAQNVSTLEDKNVGYSDAVCKEYSTVLWHWSRKPTQNPRVIWHKGAKIERNHSKVSLKYFGGTTEL